MGKYSQRLRLMEKLCATQSFITKVGKKIGSQYGNVFFQISGVNPNKEIAVKTITVGMKKL